MACEIIHEVVGKGAAAGSGVPNEAIVRKRQTTRLCLAVGRHV